MEDEVRLVKKLFFGRRREEEDFGESRPWLTSHCRRRSLGERAGPCQYFVGSEAVDMARMGTGRGVRNDTTTWEVVCLRAGGMMEVVVDEVVRVEWRKRESTERDGSRNIAIYVSAGRGKGGGAEGGAEWGWSD